MRLINLSDCSVPHRCFPGRTSRHEVPRVGRGVCVL